MAGLTLDKWYLDVVSDDGEVLVGYAAKLTAMVAGVELGIDYTSRLDAGPTGTPTSRTSLSAALPTEDGRTIRWSAPRIDVRGRFEPIVCGPRAMQVHTSDGGSVTWSCIAPVCKVDLEGGPSGLGYAERLVVTVPPWRLPLDKLVWGRFVSADASLVWMDWSGAEARRIVIVDGARCETAELGHDEIRVGGTRLEIRDRKILREGAIGSTALAAVRALEHIVPAGFLATIERKWLARGKLTRVDGRTSEGWIIDEVVEWAR